MEQQTNEQLEKKPGDAGMTGHASWVLKDKDGKIKQIGSTQNKITARGLDYIISHIITGAWYGAAGTSLNENTTTYHGQYSSANYIDRTSTPSDLEKNPFKYLALIYVAVSGNVTPSFSEGITNTQYKIHKNFVTGVNQTDTTGVDIYVYNEKIGDSSTAFDGTNAHLFGATLSGSVEPSTRSRILGGKNLSEKNASSKQSNEDATPKFEKVYLIFNFAATEGVCNGSESINSIAWMSSDGSSGPGKEVGARLEVSPGINKQNGDTLDITYTFDLQ